MKNDPYVAVLHVAQQLQAFEDRRGEFSRDISNMLDTCRQLMRSHDLTADERVILAQVMQDTRGDMFLLAQFAMFDRMSDWGTVLSRVRQGAVADGR